jgi:signal transduction histidine kinase
VRQAVAAARETAPHRIELVVGPDDASVPATVAAAVGEALTNVRKHARASRVVVYGEDLDRRAVTTVRDDGVGADPVVIRSGRGVSDSIVGRIAGVGGSVEIQSGGQGTMIVIRVPAGGSS